MFFQKGIKIWCLTFCEPKQLRKTNMKKICFSAPPGGSGALETDIASKEHNLQLRPGPDHTKGFGSEIQSKSCSGGREVQSQPAPRRHTPQRMLGSPPQRHTVKDCLSQSPLQWSVMQGSSALDGKLYQPPAAL